MFAKEISEMEELTRRAVDCIQRDNIGGARALLGRVRKFFPMTEQARCIAMIEACILIRRRKKRQAKERVLLDNYAAWGSPDLWYVLRLCNPELDAKTRLFKITLKGGYATFGFTQFTAEHICGLEILANSDVEALEYAHELCRFAEPLKVSILSIAESPFVDPDETHRGIVSTSPFRYELEAEVEGASAGDAQSLT